MIIPTTADIADQELSIDIADTTLVIRAKWNTTAEKWFLTISDEQASVIVGGVALVRGLNVLTEYTDDRLPKGFLGIVALADVSGECGRDDLGKNFQLVYEEVV